MFLKRVRMAATGNTGTYSPASDDQERERGRMTSAWRYRILTKEIAIVPLEIPGGRSRGAAARRSRLTCYWV